VFEWAGACERESGGEGATKNGKREQVGIQETVELRVAVFISRRSRSGKEAAAQRVLRAQIFAL
jgi:hypothetical protein